MHIAVTLDRRQHVVGRLSAPRKKKTTLSAVDYLLAPSATTPRFSVTSDRALFHWRTVDTARGCIPEVVCTGCSAPASLDPPGASLPGRR